MLEAAVEDYLIDRCRELGGIAWKLPSQWYRHIPDRLVLLPGARIAFVELKRPGEEPRPGQVRMGRWLTALGFQWACPDTKDKVEQFLIDICCTIKMDTKYNIKTKNGEVTGMPLYQVEGDIIWHISPEAAIAYFEKYVMPKLMLDEY